MSFCLELCFHCHIRSSIWRRSIYKRQAIKYPERQPKRIKKFHQFAQINCTNDVIRQICGYFTVILTIQQLRWCCHLHQGIVMQRHPWLAWYQIQNVFILPYCLLHRQQYQYVSLNFDAYINVFTTKLASATQIEVYVANCIGKFFDWSMGTPTSIPLANEC